MTSLHFRSNLAPFRSQQKRKNLKSETMTLSPLVFGKFDYDCPRGREGKKKKKRKGFAPSFRNDWSDIIGRSIIALDVNQNRRSSFYDQFAKMASRLGQQTVPCLSHGPAWNEGQLGSPKIEKEIKVGRDYERLKREKLWRIGEGTVTQSSIPQDWENYLTDINPLGCVPGQRCNRQSHVWREELG